MSANMIDTLTFVDWQQSKRVELENVPRSATVGETLSAAVRAMELPFKSAFQAAFRGRQLNRAETLDEAGLDSGHEVRVVPEVSAG